jgi:hypothetical protein
VRVSSGRALLGVVRVRETRRTTEEREGRDETESGSKEAHGLTPYPIPVCG